MATYAKKNVSATKKPADEKPPFFRAVPLSTFTPKLPDICKCFLPPDPFEPRQILLIQDFMMITGQSESTARRAMAKINEKFKKTHLPFISVKHFCKYHNIKEDEVQNYFKAVAHWECMDAIYRKNSHSK